MVMIFLICKKIISSIIHQTDPAPHIHAVSTFMIALVSHGLLLLLVTIFIPLIILSTL